MKLSERIKDMHERMTAPNIAELAVESWATEVAQLEEENRWLRRIIEVNAPGVDIEYNFERLALLAGREHWEAVR